jgi:hypothetical protein
MAQMKRLGLPSVFSDGSRPAEGVRQTAPAIAPARQICDDARAARRL